LNDTIGMNRCYYYSSDNFRWK